MKKGWKIAAIVAMIAVLGVATVGVVAYAQEATTGSSSIVDLGQRVKEAIAEALGISVEKYAETVTAAEKKVLDEAVAAGEITQGQADRMQNRLDGTGGFGGMGKMGRGPWGFGPDGVNLLTVAAEKLGMTETELMTELRDGKSIADVAKEKGIDTQVISDAFLAQAKEKLDALVSDGTLTQAQADTRLTEETDALPDRLTGTGMMGDGFGRGGDRWGLGPDGVNLLTVAAEKLGMAESELMTELQGGKTIAGLAKDKSIDTQVISDAYLAQVKEKLDALVADGTLTQAQADARLTNETDELPNRLTSTWDRMGGPGGRGHGGRPDGDTGTAGGGNL
jgi:polyhydroxyalkanoate synthesis regulator phasin